MKRILPCIMLCGLLWTACKQSPEAEQAPVTEVEATKPAALKPLPPAVEDPPNTDRSLGQAQLKDVSIKQASIELDLKLPPAYESNPVAGNAKAVHIIADDGSFQLIVEPADIAPEDLPLLWESQPPVGSFRQFVVNGRGGVLAEVERDGKLDYQVDYLMQHDQVTYRLHTPTTAYFSKMQATKIFNVCRQAK